MSVALACTTMTSNDLIVSVCCSGLQITPGPSILRPKASIIETVYPASWCHESTYDHTTGGVTVIDWVHAPCPTWIWVVSGFIRLRVSGTTYACSWIPSTWSAGLIPFFMGLFSQLQFGLLRHINQTCTWNLGIPIVLVLYFCRKGNVLRSTNVTVSRLKLRWMSVEARSLTAVCALPNSVLFMFMPQKGYE